jgi:hypothetical protein
MAARLPTLRTGRALLRRNIIFLLVLRVRTFTSKMRSNDEIHSGNVHAVKSVT